MNQRNKRQDLIRSIIRKQKIKTQRALGLALSEAGHPATQATISRDISEMGLRKNAAEGTYYLPEDLHLQRMVYDLVNEITAVNNLLIVKAATGTAPGVAAALDEVILEGIVGSVSGDDTILLVAQTNENAAALEAQLNSYLPLAKQEKGEGE